MKRFEAAICLSLITIFSTTNAAWQMVWQDNFDGNKINQSNWGYDQGWGNDELECYTVQKTKNARVENGHLTIDVQVENLKNRNYTSARLTSKHSWAYGKFEANASLPKGKYLWPAIWLFPANEVYGGWAASGEIDIMELRGDTTNQIEATIHYGGAYPNNTSSGSGEITFPVDFSAGFHLFSLEWNVTQMTFFVDNKEYYNVNINKSLWSGKGKNPYTKNGQPFDQPFYWILNIAVGGSYFPEDTYGTLTVEEAKLWPKPTMEVDFVRVSQWK